MYKYSVLNINYYWHPCGWGASAFIPMMPKMPPPLREKKKNPIPQRQDIAEEVQLKKKEECNSQKVPCLHVLSFVSLLFFVCV